MEQDQSVHRLGGRPADRAGRSRSQAWWRAAQGEERPAGHRLHLPAASCINTANIALDAADRLWIPVQRDWRLNERHYGALQGKNKTEIRQEYGDEKFMLWRRSYATPPPEIDPNDQYAQNHDPRYAGDPVPEAECLANVVERVKPYFESAIEPELRAGKTVLIAAHGNSLRAIVKMLDNLSEDEIAKVNIPTAIPLLYELDENFKPVKPRGEYLDPEAAAAGAAAVAAQGQK